jgi:uncharacterized protein YbaA (DUF1428 family)
MSSVKPPPVYVDGFILPLPRKNLRAYIRLAKACADLWLQHGALEYFECVADDVKTGKVTSFPRSVKLKKAEVVIFSWITYKSRAHRDRVLKKVMADPRMEDIANSEKVADMFDGMRMIWGGFKTVVRR